MCVCVRAKKFYIFVEIFDSTFVSEMKSASANVKRCGIFPDEQVAFPFALSISSVDSFIATCVYLSLFGFCYDNDDLTTAKIRI